MKEIKIFEMPDWPLDPARGKQDYELLDSGDGKKLERFGLYTFIRPEARAIWSVKAPAEIWKKADGEFKVDGAKGSWVFKNKIKQFEMQYKDFKFLAEPTPFRHMGVFPEQANHWDFMIEKIKSANRPIKFLNLFGYTGLASLAAASAGAKVTHVDSSKKTMTWANENQKLSGLEDSIRWITDDALKFLQREERRGEKYDAIIIDPPKFGRGPKGEVWKIEENLTELLQACRNVLSDKPLFFIATLYTVDFSALSLGQAVEEIMNIPAIKIENGELVIKEKSAGRLLSLAITSRSFWG